MSAVTDMSADGSGDIAQRAIDSKPVEIPDLHGEPGSLSPAAEAAAAALSRRSISRAIVSGVVRIGEGVIIAGMGILMVLAVVEPAERYPWPYGLALLGAVTIFAALAQSGGLYSFAPARPLGAQISRIFVIWLSIFATLAVAVFLTRSAPDFSRGWFIAWFAAGFAGLVAFRIAVSAQLRSWSRKGLFERRAVIVGGGARAEELILALQAAPDVRICGIFDDRDDDRSPAVVRGYPKLGTIPELVTFARKARIDLLIVTIPLTAEKRVLTILQQLWVLPIDIKLSAQNSALRFRDRTYSFVGGIPFLDIADNPIADWNHVSKWLFDRILGALILLLALPVMGAVALAVKLESRGPVLFKQKRYGFNNEVIEVYKFRSMFTDLADHKALTQVTRDDPRVTRVGRFIRRTSLDELPQLFNVVFKGNVSLVGPRPHAVEGRIVSNKLFEQVVDGYFARHRVKPGVTGWAQVNGLRGIADTAEKVEKRLRYDFYYIENWSVLFDLYILMLTPLAVLKGENAY